VETIKIGKIKGVIKTARRWGNWGSDRDEKSLWGLEAGLGSRIFTNRKNGVKKG